MIVIPMAGRSRRFTEVGYSLPKYMLPIRGEPVFAHAVRSFEHYFSDTSFLFVAGDVADSARFVHDQCERLGLANAKIHVLAQDTGGQAETVDLGLDAAQIGDDEPLTIFNIDTFRSGFRFPQAEWLTSVDGYIEVFCGSGANWSYVRSADSAEPRVLETAEKRPISDLCCTGLYHFAKAADFRAALAAERENPSSAELYIAPIYNHLIAAGKTIYYDVVSRERIVFCGVPAEYEALVGEQH